MKRRPPKTIHHELTEEQVNAFAAGADHSIEETNHTPSLDQNANRDFKAIRVPFNEFEYRKLEELANLTGRSKLNAIRFAVSKLVEEELKKIK